MGRARNLGFAWAVGLLVLMTTPAWAQDGDNMDFSVEETGGDGDSMDFSVEETETAAPSDGLVITGLIVRSDSSVDPELPGALSVDLLSELDQLNGYQSRPNTPLQQKFAEMGEQGALDCIYNPICLSRVGKELGFQRLVIGRLSGTSGNFSLDLDLVNVEEGTVADYVNRTVKGDDDDLRLTIHSSMVRLFNLRKRKRKTGPAEVAEIGPIQKGLAWTSIGVGVVGLGLGAYFGIDASSKVSDLENGQRVELGSYTPYTITQGQARKMLQEAEDSASLSNIFYGVGLAAGVTGALLFLIRPGSDIATEEELSSDNNFRVQPILGADNAGISAGFDW